MNFAAIKIFLKKHAVLLGVLFAIVLLYFSLRKINWIDLKNIFHTTSYFLLFEILIISIVSRLLISYRWYLLLSFAKNVKFMSALDYTNIGYLINNIFPARLGDLIKAIMWSKQEKQARTMAVASVGVERIYDILGLGMVFLVVLIIQNVSENVKYAGWTMISIAIVGILNLRFISGSFLQKLIKPEEYKANYIRWFFRKMEMFIQYSYIFKNLKLNILLILSTGLIWFTYVLIGYIIAIEIVPHELAWQASLLSLVIVGLSFVIPSTPGNIGVYQFACVLAFGIIGLDKTSALAYSLISQFSVYIFSFVIGFISLWRRGYSIKTLEIESKKVKNEM